MDSGLFLYVIIAVIVIALVGVLALRKRKDGGTAPNAPKAKVSSDENPAEDDPQDKAPAKETPAENTTENEAPADSETAEEAESACGAASENATNTDAGTTMEYNQKDPASFTEEEALKEAQMQMAQAHQRIHDALQAFRRLHNELVAGIYLEAKAGCDSQFRQRFGITRPPRARLAQDDPEVQDFLRENYALLRDAVLAKATLYLMEQETQHRLDALMEDSNGKAKSTANLKQPSTEEEPPVNKPAGRIASEGETPANELAERAPSEAESAANNHSAPKEDESSGGKTAEIEAASASADERAEETAESGATEEGALRADIAKKVQNEFDSESVRVYILAAISARYSEEGNAIGDLPWPAYATLSAKGYGELTLCEGAPVFAQNAYREFAWKRFHTGKRAEKPTRGEYSWPASHELGDGAALYQFDTPAGSFTAEGPQGALPLCEWNDCAWMRHSLEYQGALLVPAVQRSFLINLEGLHRGDAIKLAFEGDSFLKDIGDSAFFLNAMGEAPGKQGSFVGISISNANAAGPGEAPYELESRNGTGFLLRMTQDARHYDADTYPQFLEAHISWAQEPSPRPERIIRHVTH